MASNWGKLPLTLVEMMDDRTPVRYVVREVDVPKDFKVDVKASSNSEILNVAQYKDIPVRIDWGNIPTDERIGLQINLVRIGQSGTVGTTTDIKTNHTFLNRVRFLTESTGDQTYADLEECNYTVVVTNQNTGFDFVVTEDDKGLLITVNKPVTEEQTQEAQVKVSVLDKDGNPFGGQTVILNLLQKLEDGTVSSHPDYPRAISIVVNEDPTVHTESNLDMYTYEVGPDRVLVNYAYQLNKAPEGFVLDEDASDLDGEVQHFVFREKSFNVSLDGNGGTFEDGVQTVYKVKAGSVYKTPYRFQVKLTNPGYTFVGWLVEGTEDVHRYPTEITIEQDTTLIAQWQVTEGGFRIHDYTDGFRNTDKLREFKLFSEDGTEYPMTSNSFTSNYRQWKVDGVPNESYTLVVTQDGEAYRLDWMLEKFGQSDTTSDYRINEDGDLEFDLTFVDDKSTTFIRYRLNADRFGLAMQIRDDSGNRTNTIPFTVTDAYGNVIDGKFDEFFDWHATSKVHTGTYTVIFDAPKHVVRVDSSIHGQTAYETEEGFKVDVRRPRFRMMTNIDVTESSYGAFIATESFTVTFDANGGTFEEDAVTVYTVENNTEFNVPTDLIPTREDYVFTGWANEEGTLVESLTVTSDVTLSAQWERETGSIDLTIVDTDGNPVAGVVVEIDGQEYTSNEDGKVEVADLETGDFEVVVLSVPEGYILPTTTTVVSVLADEVSETTIVLELEEVEEPTDPVDPEKPTPDIQDTEEPTDSKSDKPSDKKPKLPSTGVEPTMLYSLAGLSFLLGGYYVLKSKKEDE